MARVQCPLIVMFATCLMSCRSYLRSRKCTFPSVADSTGSINIPTGGPSRTQTLPSQIQQSETAQITPPPNPPPRPTPFRRINENVNSPIQNPRRSIRQSSRVDNLRRNPCVRREQQTAHKQGVILDRVGMGSFIALEHVELTTRHFPLSHSSLAVFGEVFAWRGLVVDAVPLLEGAGGEDAVGPEEVEG